jgi:cytochrome c1
MTFDRVLEYKKKSISHDKESNVSETMQGFGRQNNEYDEKSIAKGKFIFEEKCRFCHRAYGTDTLVGPGLKGILKRDKLPVSGKPATPENIKHQLLNPFRDMPSFKYLSDSEIEDIISFLGTL